MPSRLDRLVDGTPEQRQRTSEALRRAIRWADQYGEPVATAVLRQSLAASDPVVKRNLERLQVEVRVNDPLDRVAGMHQRRTAPSVALTFGRTLADVQPAPAAPAASTPAPRNRRRR